MPFIFHPCTYDRELPQHELTYLACKQLPCGQLASPTPDKRETTASNGLLFHQAWMSLSRPT